jgi:hypothetical protein
MLLDCLRIYDEAISEFVGKFAVEGKPVITIFATPDRPFAEVVQEISREDESFRSQMEESNLICSVGRMDPQYNPKLRVDSPFGKVLSAPVSTEGDVLTSEYPRPYIIPYQLDLRSRSRTLANLWSQWIMFKFNPYVCLYPNFGALWGGQKQIQLILNQIIDNSELETGESERWIRWTVTLRILNAWIFPIPENLNDIPDPFGMFKVYKVVKEVVVETYLSPDSPPVPDPTIPGVVLVDTEILQLVESSAGMTVESN